MNVVGIAETTADDGPSPPRTLAQASRARRDIVSGMAMDESRLIRFVEGPDSRVVPDLARKLPGRGVWVAADRRSVEAACKQRLFARALKTRVEAAPDLADSVEGRLVSRLLSALGLAKKAGEIVSGYEKTQNMIVVSKAAILIEACDGADGGRRKLLSSLHRSQLPPRLVGLFSSGDLGLALGTENVVHIAFLAGRSAERWLIEVDRLAGFRPLCPESWDL